MSGRCSMGRPPGPFRTCTPDTGGTRTSPRRGERPTRRAPRSDASRGLHDRAHLDRAVLRARAHLGRLDGLLDRLALDHVEPAELLLRLGERPVDDERLAV